MAGGVDRALSYETMEEVKNMKVVSLCSKDSCCPVVKIMDTKVEIGEKDNTCILTKEQWEALKEKILRKEL